VAQARIIGDVLKIATWNVNGVRARQAEVQAFIETHPWCGEWRSHHQRNSSNYRQRDFYGKHSKRNRA
jgi:exonuclease III